MLSHLECARCGQRHDADRPQNLCRSCSSPLLARYDLTKAGRPTGDNSLWRYRDVLPVRDPDPAFSLGEGMTPLVPLPALSRALDVNVLMKDESLIPTGSFKARGAAVGVARVKELGIEGIKMPTNGNAGAAWALYAARAGLRSVIAMPEDAPLITREEVEASGAELRIVPGTIADAAKALADVDLFDASTLKEPYRIEGKKTMGYEIAEQLGWRVPDVIVYPTGGGVGLIGIHKALNEMRELGWIDGPLPRLVAVQSTGCAPIVRAFDEGAAESTFWDNAFTNAFGINVPKPLGDFLILRAIRETNGTAIAVDDGQILEDRAECARLEGVFLCPEGAATLSAVRVLRKDGWLRAGDEVVVLNTGAGIKYPGVRL
ncbi:threonine synthase [Lentzea flava]|uniref:Threonine synthase n=1 Tax=Lentzea flava TaxID=103732 RepID=A0ABQ2V5R9_9PSEU|nr:threonine synthase [Lentzea flava]MCP2203260.1 threonine synthase [Lentzea flava]GGU66833.1 threonine synthase [Lentzea flava]